MPNKGTLKQRDRTDRKNCDKISLPCGKLFIFLIVFQSFNVREEGQAMRAEQAFTACPFFVAVEIESRVNREFVCVA